MPALPRPLVWLPWVIALALTIAIAVWQWTAWVQETEAEAMRIRERERAMADSLAREEAARARTYDALIRATMRHKEVDLVKAEKAPPAAERPRRKPSETRQKPLPTTTTATDLNCQRLRKAYTPEELAAMPTFKQACQ